MEEFKKINLSSSPSAKPEETVDKKEQQPMMVTRRIGRNIRLPKRQASILLGILFILGIFVFFGIVLPAQRVYRSAMLTKTQAQKAYEAMKKQNVELASLELAKTRESLTTTQKDLQGISYLRFIPIASGYYNDADHLMKAGFEGLNASLVLVDSLKPYADVLGLKGQGSFVMGSAEQRIQTAILTMGKITPKIDEIAGSLEKARQEIDEVDPNHYPPFFGGEKIRNQLKTMQTVADEGVVFVNEARPLIKVLPSLLGESKEKKYLVIFQNDKELRPTGGFITAYAIFSVDKGVIHVDRSDDIYNLDNQIPRKAKAPEPILKYLPKVAQFNLRDSNLSPDFVDSMQTFMEMYNKAANKVPVDGVIGLDTHVLVSTIKILDDEIQAGGLTFTTKIDKRCDCPQVIYSLEDNISRPVGYIKENRKGLLGQLLYAIMQKALKSSPKLYWGPLFQDFVSQTNQKHVLFYLLNKDAQNGVEALNAAGRIKSFDGDYLHINQANFAGGKANLFVSESVSQAFVKQGDGSIEKTVTINYKNPYPPSDCNLERGGLCLNAPLRDWVRIYVPKGSKLISSQGSEVKMTTSQDLGKTVFEGFLTVRPQGAAVLTIKYTLPFKPSNNTLPFLIQKQPGTNNFPYSITVNGKEVNKFDLTSDKELKIALP
ncbi:MAG: DUF4012 domain-containing protein [Candidatus Levybacteria bacterium]|nr:DUF4012 domain-containing protein [Candidatus Levybacteria bacterium]